VGEPAWKIVHAAHPDSPKRSTSRRLNTGRLGTTIDGAAILDPVLSV
jgi:hypothetical protein